MPNELQRSRAAFWILTILVVTTLANLVVGQLVPRSVRPVSTSPGGSLGELIVSGPRGVAERYAFYFALGEQDGDTLVVFQGAEVNQIFLAAFGRMDLVSTHYEPSGNELGDLGEPSGKFRTDDLRIVDFWVVPGQPGDNFWLATYEGGYAAVAESVVPFPGGTQ